MTDNKSHQNPRLMTIPISLGKPSLRRRLEDYYSLVNPSATEDAVKWRSKFDQIYEKYGGTYAGERTLAAKLVKKYGGFHVRLLRAESVLVKKKEDSPPTVPRGHQREESWFALRPEEQGSGVISMTSDQFDPQAALEAPRDQVAQENPWVAQTPFLAHTGQVQHILPKDDPLYKPLRRRTPKAKKETKKTDNHPFADIAKDLNYGPFSVMYRIWEQRQRACVLIRYVNGIRGTLTGRLLAFDRHFNMILTNVEEVYQPRDTSTRYGVTQEPQNDDKSLWTSRKRRMRQIMVRGDNVVLVYKAPEKTLPGKDHTGTATRKRRLSVT
ncbi:LSM domain [Seminavis robusta]|uniref:LSM domain n=1 Tax=Seminavis robusta TaxID=568900 RepID=A0A9N8HKD5_9STRA|nr:LSM domain [Seminavis robusta]|eukprot:Sro749_g196790.1 LSM domain (326) ;mRNA; r:17375-18352